MKRIITCFLQLLGKESNDIDIALSSIMGIAFAELFVPFLEDRGIQVRNVTKIARNPEQSKHLETCTATLMGMGIDFVNLRSEEYAVGSRIPTKIVRPAVFARHIDRYSSRFRVGRNMERLFKMLFGGT